MFMQMGLWQGPGGGGVGPVTGLFKQPRLLVEDLERLAQPNSLTREALEQELGQVARRLGELPREERRLVQGYRKRLYPDFLIARRLNGSRQSGSLAKCAERSWSFSWPVWTEP